MDSDIAKTGAIAIFVAGLALAGVVLVHQAQYLDRHGKIVIAAGNSHYFQLASRYGEELKNFGVEVEIKRSTEGFAALKSLTDNSSGVTAGFVKGGLVGSLRGRLATEKAKGRHIEFSSLFSLGRLFYEPVWVFTRGELPIHSLRDLKGKTVLLGTRESGSRRVVRQLLLANGVDRDNAKFLDEDLTADAAALKSGKADAGILIQAADSETVQQLLRVPNLRLMDFSPEADAYVNRFPALTKVVLREGSVEFNPLIPSADITLLTTSVALVVRPDMQSALISLLTRAVIDNPQSGFDKNGDPVLFYRAGEFPTANDPEFAVPNDARVVYKTGELPFLLRLIAPINYRIGVPFSYTAFVSAHAAKLVLLIPLLAVLVPLGRTLPAVYVWLVRRRLVYWYRQLTALERSLDRGGDKYDPAAHRAEIERIDAHVRSIRLPLYFSDQLYDLRGHIDLVRQRLQEKAQPARMAAE
jgi:TRAP-type uncharacterized transport system substrate-binding protein